MPSWQLRRAKCALILGKTPTAPPQHCLFIYFVLKLAPQKMSFDGNQHLDLSAGPGSERGPIHLLGTFWSVSKVNRHEGLGANLGCFCLTHSLWEESRQNRQLQADLSQCRVTIWGWNVRNTQNMAAKMKVHLIFFFFFFFSPQTIWRYKFSFTFLQNSLTKITN